MLELMLFGYSLRWRRNTELGCKEIVMKADIIAVYYGMSVDRSRKILRYVWLAAARIDILP